MGQGESTGVPVIDDLLNPDPLARYDPSGVNQKLLSLGVRPDIVDEVGSRYGGRSRTSLL
jgi:hypothetical protein